MLPKYARRNSDNANEENIAGSKRRVLNSSIFGLCHADAG